MSKSDVVRWWAFRVGNVAAVGVAIVLADRLGVRPGLAILIGFTIGAVGRVLELTR